MNNIALNLATAPKVSVPSISSSAMLVELAISVWTGKKKDKRASQAVEFQNGAEDGVFSGYKKLLGNCAELKAIQDFTANVRTGIHYDMTMPWSNSGLRLLPTAKYFDYTKTMTALEAEWWKLVETFLAAYEWEAAQAQAKLGSLFARDEYPTIEALRAEVPVQHQLYPDARGSRLAVGYAGRGA